MEMRTADPLDVMSPLSSFLVASPSWKEAGRILDLGGTFDEYNTSAAPDLVAHRMDVRAVGGDMWVAFALLAAGAAVAVAASRSSR